jgi:hypothetical protein
MGLLDTPPSLDRRSELPADKKVYPLNLPTESDLYACARESWLRLKSNAHQTWDDYLVIGQALVAARTEKMRDLGINRPHGPRFRKAISAWLREHHLDDIPKAVRSVLIELMDHRPEVDEMMATWSPAQCADRNHPHTVRRYLKKWRAERGQLSHDKKPINAKPTRKQLLREIEQKDAHIKELEAAREAAPTDQPDTILTVAVKLIDIWQADDKPSLEDLFNARPHTALQDIRDLTKWWEMAYRKLEASEKPKKRLPDIKMSKAS